MYPIVLPNPITGAAFTHYEYAPIATDDDNSAFVLRDDADIAEHGVEAWSLYGRLRDGEAWLIADFGSRETVEFALRSMGVMD